MVEELEKLPKPPPGPPAQGSNSARILLTTARTRDDPDYMDNDYESNHFDEESDLDSAEDQD